MNSDNYEFSKSSHPQSVSEYTAYTDKQWNNVPDINSGVYNTNGLALVTWDLTSIYNASGLSDVSDLFLAVPLVTVATVSAGATTLAQPTAGYSLCSLKSNYQNLIHQIEVTSNGKAVNDMQPFVNVYENFKLLSQLSATDLKSNTPSFNINECLDNEKSVQWVGAAANGKPGLGLCNNLPFSTAAPGTVAIAQNANQYNNAIYNRASKIIDTTANSTFNNIVGTVGSLQNIQAEFKSYYTVVGAAAPYAMVWYDVALIPLKYICDCVDKMGLVKKLDIGLRVYFNIGCMQITVVNPNATTCYYGAIRGTTFSNTCPLSINYLGVTSANGGLPATTDTITAGVYIAKPPSTFGPYTSITLPAIPAHQMPSCRCYYSQVKLDPQRMLTYIEENRSKQVVYENFLFNQYTSIGSSATFSQLIQSGIKNPIGVAIIPMISTTASSGLTGYAQYASPYDQCPSSYAPLSLTNLSVNLGGVNVLNTTLYYTFENFLEQVSLAESLTSSDIGISCGLINQSWWEMNRVYFVDLSRGRESDKATMRNLVISFNNNNLVPIDLMVFTIYLDKFTIDVETGIVQK